MSWHQKSYETLPALSLRRSELRRSLSIVTLGWSFGVVWFVSVIGSRMNIFGRMLGFSNFHFGLLTSLAFMATFGQLIAAIWIEKTGLRKRQFLYYGSIHRMLWLVVAAIPFIAMIPGVPDLPAPWAIWTMMLAILASKFAEALMAPAWWTWMGDLIPRRIRGRYFAVRGRITRLVQIPAVIGLALWLDHVTIEGAPITAEAQPVLLWTICAIFALAALMGTIDILLFKRIREVVATTPELPRKPAIDIKVSRDGSGPLAYFFSYLAEVVRQILLGPLREKTFRRYVIYFSTITFGMTVGGPFFWRHMLENLEISQVGTDSLFMVLGPLVGLVAVKIWGRVIDKWGRRPVFIIGTSLTVFSILPYFLVSPQTPNPQWVIQAANSVASWAGSFVGHGDIQWLNDQMPVGAWLIMSTSLLIGSTGWSGIFMAQSGVVLGFSDGEGKSKYVAASAVLISIGGVMGGLVGGIVAQQLEYFQHNPIIVGPFLWNNWHATFVLAWLARVAALCLVFGMIDPGSRRVRDLFRNAGWNAYNYVSSGLFYRLRIFGPGRDRLDDSGDSDNSDDNNPYREQ